MSTNVRSVTESRPPVLAEVIAVLERLYDPSWARDWDRVGLVCGDPQAPVRRVLLAVDPVASVVDEALDWHADLVITHHPLLLRGVHSAATTTAKGRCLTRLIRADLALLTAHTNADVADPGVCDALTAAFGLVEVSALQVEEGQPLGRVGRLGESMSLRDFAARVASSLPSAPVGIRVSGPAHAPVSRVAVLGGAGDGQFAGDRAAGADVYVTADLRHHPALEAREEAGGGPPYLIDAGHWATEWLWLQGAAQRLQDALAAEGLHLETTISTRCTDPWSFVVGTGHDDTDPRTGRTQEGQSR